MDFKIGQKFLAKKHYSGEIPGVVTGALSHKADVGEVFTHHDGFACGKFHFLKNKNKQQIIMIDEGRLFEYFEAADDH